MNRLDKYPPCLPPANLSPFLLHPCPVYLYSIIFHIDLQLPLSSSGFRLFILRTVPCWYSDCHSFLDRNCSSDGEDIFQFQWGRSPHQYSEHQWVRTFSPAPGLHWVWHLYSCRILHWVHNSTWGVAINTELLLKGFREANNRRQQLYVIWPFLSCT